MNIVEPKTLKGFMELLPEEQILFNKIKNTIKENYEKYGFLPLDTPVLEAKEILLSKTGGDTEKQVYTFTKGSTDLAMRFDLTVPLAKYVAKNYNDLLFPFKRYQIDKVYRGERPQRGRFRELYQADIDIIGDETLTLVNDAELPSIIYSIFKELNIGKFTIRINNRKILTGLYDALDLRKESVEILRIVDKVDKIGIENVEKELESLGILEEKIKKIVSFISIKGTNEEILSGIKSLGISNEEFEKGIKELEEVLGYIKAFGVDENYYNIDLSIARGLDYYTGTIYETTLDEYPNIGSICSGGRYDNLAENFTIKKLPGVGISIGLTRLYDQLTNLNVIEVEKTRLVDYLVISNTENTQKVLEIVGKLRQKGLKVELYSENKKFKAKMKYADRSNIENVIIIGDNEISENLLTIKNMKTGEQTKKTIEEIK